MGDHVNVLYTASDIRDRVRALGAAIDRDYSGREPTLVTVLLGGAMFLADLLRSVEVHAKVDFMSISRYEETAEPTGIVRIEQDLDSDIGGDDVIVVEDIVDTGLTLSYLLSTLREREPASLEVCALLDKEVRRIAPLEIRYRGFDCPDEYVVGYGLDLDGRFRNLPFIVSTGNPAALSEDPGALREYLGEGGEPYR